MKKLYSDAFIVGSYTWRILVYPKGDNGYYLSTYLNAVDSAALPKGWKKYARFRLKLINQVDSKQDVTEETEHHFSAEASDWGFVSFIPLAHFYNTHPANGYLLHDTCIIVAEISVNQIVANKATTITALKSDGQVKKSPTTLLVLQSIKGN